MRESLPGRRQQHPEGHCMGEGRHERSRPILMVVLDGRLPKTACHACFPIWAWE